MSVRLLLTDEAWAEIAPILATLKSRAGSPPTLSDRLFIEAILYLARTGTPWRDLPKDFGHWDAVYNRFRRWEARGLWRRLWERLQTEACPTTRHLFIDATIVRAHQHAAGALKKRGPSRTGSGPLSGRLVHQNSCGLSRRTHRHRDSPHGRTLS